MIEGAGPMQKQEGKERVRRAANDMSISKKARDYWRNQLQELESS